MAVPDPNSSPNLGARRRRRGRKNPPGLQRIKARLGPDALQKARAVGLRRRGGAPASDARRRSARGLPVPPRPVAPRQSTVSPVERIATRVKPASSAAPSGTPSGQTGVGTKPAKPAVPAGQPPAFGARRKATLPPGLAKRTTGSTSAVSVKPRSSAMPKPPKRPKRPKGY